MLTATEVEIKATINLNTLVFEKHIEPIIVNIEESEFTKEEYEQMCSMVAYRVKDNDNLWDIARKYYTTVDMLKEVNKIVDKGIKKGDKLLIVR